MGPSFRGAKCSLRSAAGHNLVRSFSSNAALAVVYLWLLVMAVEQVNLQLSQCAGKKVTPGPCHVLPCSPACRPARVTGYWLCLPICLTSCPVLHTISELLGPGTVSGPGPSGRGCVRTHTTRN